jgi:hypothetical protein
VDFAPEPLLGFKRELLRQRRGRGEHELDARQPAVAGEEVSQVIRRGDEQPRRGQRAQRRDDLVRVKGISVAQRPVPGQQREDRRLESVHVLRRHGGDDVERAIAEPQAAVARRHR